MFDFLSSTITDAGTLGQATRAARQTTSAHASHQAAWRARSTGPVLALFVFFVSLYLLTMGGHLDSPDEELMFAVTRSLVERASFDVGNASLPLALEGVNGRAYAPYGPVSSIVSVPFYVAGHAASAALPARYSEVIDRFAFGLRNSVVTALECVLFFLVAREIGVSRRVATLLTLAFGTATVIWPYARHAFSEPVTGLFLLLSVFAAIRAVRSDAIGWSILSAVAVGLSLGSKISTSVVLPGLAIYLCLAGDARTPRRIKRLLPFVLTLCVPGLGMMLLNVRRFGNPLSTGYGTDGLFALWPPLGIAGLLASPSKSLFLYVPVALLGLGGLWRMARGRQPWEAALFVWLVLSHVVAYGLIAIWPGDASWGPRYLVPIVPFIVLPVGVLLDELSGRARRVVWSLFAVLTAIGVVINLAAVVVDQRVGFIDLLVASGSRAPTDEQRWDPKASPVLVQWQEFFNRVTSLARSWSQPVTLISGTYGRETVDPVDLASVKSDLFPRWTTGTTAFDVRNNRQPVTVLLEYLDNRPGGIGPISVLVDGTPLPDAAVNRYQSTDPLPDGRQPWFVEASVDEPARDRDSVRVELQSKTWRPALDTPPSKDTRSLGIEIWSVEFLTDGNPLPVSESLFTPMPVTDAQPWGYDVETWFYTPPHLVDEWLWFLSLSGLSHWYLLLALVPIAGLVWSVLALTRSLQPAATPRMGVGDTRT